MRVGLGGVDLEWVAGACGNPPHLFANCEQAVLVTQRQGALYQNSHCELCRYERRKKPASPRPIRRVHELESHGFDHTYGSSFRPLRASSLTQVCSLIWDSGIGLRGSGGMTGARASLQVRWTAWISCACTAQRAPSAAAGCILRSCGGCELGWLPAAA